MKSLRVAVAVAAFVMAASMLAYGTRTTLQSEAAPFVSRRHSSSALDAAATVDRAATLGARREDEVRKVVVVSDPWSSGWSRNASSDLFVVHWTHVPKAGGTAFVSLAKKVACARNPGLAASSPCCVKNVCVAEGSCYATASTCPLVQGIGRHTSNMARLATAPCCSREWSLSTLPSFLRYALRPPPTEDELRQLGLTYGGGSENRSSSANFSVFAASTTSKRREEEDDDDDDLKKKKKKKKKKPSIAKTPATSIAEAAGEGKRSQLALRALSYATWPMARRVEFFARAGVSVDELEFRLLQKEVVAKEELGELLQIARAASPFPINETYGFRPALVDARLKKLGLDDDDDLVPPGATDALRLANNYDFDDVADGDTAFCTGFDDLSDLVGDLAPPPRLQPVVQ